jgi:transcriptional regulator with XRE-family HTH domain
MIYRIEAGQASPTIVVLNKLAIGLGVPLPALLGPGDSTEPRLNLRHPVASRRAQATWLDRASGYSRRRLTPATVDAPLQLSEARLPAGARISFESAFREPKAHQQLWMLEGNLEVRAGDEAVQLRSGDCMAIVLEAPVSLHNPGAKGARYLHAIVRIAK